jgi:hypothetical protein
MASDVEPPQAFRRPGAQLPSARRRPSGSNLPICHRGASHLLGRSKPQNDESACKRRSTGMRNGAPWLKTTLIQCSWAAPGRRAAISTPSSTASAHGAAPKSHRRRCFHPHRGLPHAQGWNLLLIRRPRSLRSLCQDRTDQTPGRQTSEPRLCRPDHPSGGMIAFMFLVREGSC